METRSGRGAPKGRGAPEGRGAPKGHGNRNLLRVDKAFAQLENEQLRTEEIKVLKDEIAGLKRSNAVVTRLYLILEGQYNGMKHMRKEILSG